jgi:hypothetical protein
MQADPITRTAACELGTHRCRSVVLSLTDAHLSDCACECHDQIPDQGDEEEVALEILAEREIEAILEREHFGDYGYDDGRWS